jgi:hypothetical protein
LQHRTTPWVARPPSAAVRLSSASFDGQRRP